MTTTDKNGFPTKTCTRCGGSGQYSFNMIDGTRCYGCGGTGRKYASKKVGAAVNAMKAAISAIKHPMASQLVVGDSILDIERPIEGTKKFLWSVVTSIVKTGKVRAWSLNQATYKCDVPSEWEMLITLETGRVMITATNNTYRRRMADDFDIAPYLKMAGVKASAVKEVSP
jgi:predicted  nucleic acid-binding Zn-ribbon protein